tara:strand:+ start:2044 stop:3039 length:996 start_codon:yes stop_codon:yes gene_type:complete
MKHRKIKVKMTEAYNALVHPTRKDISEFLEAQKDRLPARSGIFLTDDDESMPIYSQAPCETIYSRRSNKGFQGARIVLTKDNYGAPSTGLGGAGGTKCEAIDIVAGQLSADKEIRTSTTKSRANFALDGARIYLTERGNINHYFATENSDKLTAVSDNLKSGIGIKADHTLIIGRERVRILAGLAKFKGGERLVTGSDKVTAKIEIGAITEDDYQPAVRGENLVNYLYVMKDFVDTLSAKVDSLEQELALYRIALAGHVHFVAGAGPSTPSPTAAVEGLRGVKKLFSQKLDGIVEEFHKAKTIRQHLGTKSGAMKGVPSDYILSNTVFIGR